MTGKELMEALEQHFFEHFHIDLSTMALCRVGTYAAYIGGDGRIKVCPNIRDLSLLIFQPAACSRYNAREHCLCPSVPHIRCKSRQAVKHGLYVLADVNPQICEDKGCKAIDIRIIIRAESI